MTAELELINVPIERIPMRYSDDWHTWFEAGLDDLGVSFRTIGIDQEGISNKVPSGEFLDAYATNIYKAEQSVHLCRMAADGDLDGTTVFFHDLWHPALLQLVYIRQMAVKKTTFRIAGILHAGAYDPHDRLAKHNYANWATRFEEAVLPHVDTIIVATEFHRQLLVNAHKFLQNVIVRRFPVYSSYTHPSRDRDRTIIFPHRLVEEKRAHIVSDLARVMEGALHYKMVVTHQTCKTKDEYYRTLDKGMFVISAADQETYGIAMLEATMRGCIPLVPDRLAYTELYGKAFRYSQHHDLFERLTTWIQMIEVDGRSFLVNRLRFENHRLALQRMCDIKGTVRDILLAALGDQ